MLTYKCSNRKISLTIVLCMVFSIIASFSSGSTVMAVNDWPVTAIVTQENGGPVLKVGGVIQSPEFLYGYTGNAVDDLEVDVQNYYDEVVLSKNAGSHIYVHMNFLNEDDSSYPMNDQINQAVLSADPDAYLILRIGVGQIPFVNLPSSEWQATYDNANSRYWPSIGSNIWKTQLDTYITKYLDWLRNKSYANRVIGFQIMNMSTGEWFFDAAVDKYDDYSPAMLSAFRSWLASKYDTDSALQTAWKDSKVSLATAKIPTPTECQVTGDDYFSDIISVGKKAIDWKTFYNEEVANAIIYAAELFKTKTANKVVIGSMYGYSFQFSSSAHASGTGHYALWKVLESPSVDFLSAPVDYDHRAPTLGGLPMAPQDSLPLHGKLWITENDLRTHLSNPNSGFGRCNTPAESKNVLFRDFGNHVTRGLGLYWMDLTSRGWFNDKDLWDEFETFRNIQAADSLISSERTHRPEVAIIVDEKSMFYQQDVGYELLSPLMYDFRKAVAQSGASYGYYLLSDLPKIPSSVKTFVFLNCWYLTNTDISNINNVKNNNNLLIWHRAPGYVRDSGNSVANISNITGINMAKVPGQTSSITTVNNNTDPATQGYQGWQFGAGPNYNPSFYVNDANAVNLGTYNGTSYCSMARKNMGNWSSIYLGSVNLPAGMLRRMIKNVGEVFIYTPNTFDYVSVGRNKIMIHATTTETKTINLPYTSHVVDLRTGNTIGDLASFNVSMNAGDTALYSFTPGATSTVEIEDSAVAKTGSWYDGSGTKNSNVTESSVSYTFTGSYIALKAWPSCNKGIANVSVDGIQYPFIDMYEPGYPGVSREYIIAQDLPQGPHTVTITVSGNKNVDSIDTYLVLDAFMVKPDFNDNFSSDPDKWAPYSGTWAVESGEYSQSDTTPVFRHTSIKGETYSSFTINYDMKIVDNGGDPSNWGAIVLRKPTQADHHGNGGYMIFCTYSGDIVLYKPSVGYIKTYSTGQKLSTFKHFKVVLEGSNIRIYYNNGATPVIEVNDAEYTLGYVGLETCGAHVHFDNVVITK